MDTTATHNGIVTYYNTGRNFGFIDTETHIGVFFFNDKKETRRREKKGAFFIEGDEVQFKMRATDNEVGFEAYDLTRIRNEKVDYLLSLLEDNAQLDGYIKKVGDEYFVKDKATYLFIPLYISRWEKDLNEVYDERINQGIQYEILRKANKFKNLKATLTDKRFTETYFLLKDYKKNGQRVKATVTGKNRDGYFATLLEGTVDTFIPFDKEGRVPTNMRKGDDREVIISDLLDSGIKVALV